jgi:hypothetical protein
VPPQEYPPLASLPHLIHLSLSPQRSLELSNGPEHVGQQAARGSARVDMLLEDVEMDLLALELRHALAEIG